MDPEVENNAGPITTSGRKTELVAGCLLVVAWFFISAVSGLYDGLGEPVPNDLELLLRGAFIGSVWAWFWCYSQNRGVRWVMDMGYFIMQIGALLIPYYVFKTEGRRGWGLMGIVAMFFVAGLGFYLALATWIPLVLGLGE